MDVIDLGRIAYAAAWDRQRELVEGRARDKIPDTLLLCEHPHVVTLGRARRGEDPGGDSLPGPDGDRVPVFRVERGGEATYHGPGQLVAYAIVRLDRVRGGLNGFLRGLVAVVIRTAADFGIAACRNPGATGVWVERTRDTSSIHDFTSIGDRQPSTVNRRPSSSGGLAVPPGLLKLCSIGVAVRRWVTYHGLALNVATDLRYFRLIRPCGFDPGVMTSLEALAGATVDFGRVKEKMKAHFETMFARR